MDCSCDLEPCDVWNELERRAAKEHKCSECGGVIRKGEHYRTYKCLYEGYWSQAKHCADCTFAIAEVGREWFSECGSWCWQMTEVRSAIDEYCRAYAHDQLDSALKIAHMWNLSHEHRGGKLIEIDDLKRRANV